MIQNLWKSGAVAACALAMAITATGQTVKVSNVSASQRPDSKLVDIRYDLSGTAQLFSVSLRISSDNGITFSVPANTLSGDFGSNITSGTGRRITWNAGADWNGSYSESMRFEVTASDIPMVGERFITIASGTFRMGDELNEGNNDELPVRNVTLDSFLISSMEVEFSTWKLVANWADSRGYSFSNAGTGKANSHPVQTINWHDAVKWCNARSEMDGLTPCYRVNGEVYRSGESTPTWNRDADGYRLPTEAEWERAARGGLVGKRFPLGNTISHNAANYKSGKLSYESPQGNGFHPLYATGGYPYTSPVGTFAANGIGIYDMAGNVMEWCWDWYDPGYYSSSGSTNRPPGPDSGSLRVIRGGAWSTPGNNLRVSFRFASNPLGIGNIGLRLARNP